ncbi:MAG: AgmX/PglI C-terminal domain-containing protein, partial [Bdellovibrionales bacterium]|nr:AgmX/PglI C-terminal domain-containing protein [Bdellovibrionales bacterium]
LLPQGKKFKPNSIPGKKVFESIPSSSWNVNKFDEYTIKQKSLEFESEKAINKFKFSEVIEKDAQKGVLGLIVICLSFFIGILSIPKKEIYIPLASKRAVATQVSIKKEFKMPKMVKPKEQVEHKSETDKKASAAANIPVQKNVNKVAGMLKNVSTGRISSLLSKVSSQGRKSKNVIVSDGVAAGSGSSGRALASLGKIDKGNGDWSDASDSKGIKISTRGVGGGNSIAGIGKLNGENVGTGGVGLIEDESEVVGGLDRDVIASYIKTQLGQILYCYERQLSANKDLFGKVSVKFTISGNGKVEAQSINDSTLKNNSVEGCMLNKIAAWKFPAPKGGTKVIVTYPFLFKSTN